MQKEKDFPHHCKQFLHTLDFLRLLSKTVYDASVFEFSVNNLCLYIVNANANKFFIVSLFISLNTKRFCLVTFDLFVCIMQIHVFTINCQINSSIISDFFKFNIIYTFLFKLMKTFLLTICKTIIYYRIYVSIE